MNTEKSLLINLDPLVIFTSDTRLQIDGQRGVRNQNGDTQITHPPIVYSNIVKPCKTKGLLGSIPRVYVINSCFSISNIKEILFAKITANKLINSLENCFIIGDHYGLI